LKVNGVAGTVNVDEDTFKVTGTLNGLLFTPAAVIWMLPVSGPDVMPVVLTETVRLAGVVPVPGDTLSQEFPKVTAAFTLVELAGDEPMLNVWEAGGVPTA
jgi:hypothetical protein